MRIGRRGFLAGAAGLALGGPAASAEWPTRPIRLLTPWPAGGPLDTFLRLCQPPVQATLGQPVIVDNRPGAAGITGTIVGKNAAPDGYTVISTGASFVSQPLVQRVDYDVERDFAPISRLVVLPQVLAVHPSLPAATLEAFVTAARERPDAYNYASYGIGTTNHFAMEILKQRAGIGITHVPYKGGAPAMQDLIGGRVQAMFTVIGDGLPYFRSGQLRPLVLAHPERRPEVADVPTFTERGYPDLAAAAAAFGLVVPTGTPEAIRRRIGDAFRDAIRGPDLAARLAGLSMVPVGSSEGGYRDILRAEAATYGEIIRVAGIRIEE